MHWLLWAVLNSKNDWRKKNGDFAMKKFVCLDCNFEWYSASTIDTPCERCGGIIVDTEPSDEPQITESEKPSSQLN